MGKRSKIFRLPKVIRKRRKDIDEFSTATENSIEKHFFRRLTNLAKVRRFVIGWVTLMMLLLLVGIMQIGYLRSKYQQLYFVPGGTFKEGIIGSYTNANPIYASSSVDSSVSKLIFSGLFAYDSKQKLTPDLAEKLTIDKTEKVYTVTLKPGLYWQDGQPLTADDVVFTFKTIENPDAKSPLLPSWQGIKVESKGARTVIFTLPSSLSSFPDSLTTGIIPKHLLQSIAPDQLRSNDFNTIRPIGSGPFKYDTVEVVQKDIKDEKREQVGLVANSGYYKGMPAIKQYIISTYNNQGELLKAYDDKKVDAISQLGTVKDKYLKNQANNIYSIPIAGQTLVFFKTSQDLMADPKVRKALVLGSNRQKVIESTGQVLKRSDEPLLISQTGYDKKYLQRTGHTVLAQKVLEGDGWKLDPAKGVRVKKGNELKFRLYALSTDEYSQVANELKKEWAAIGVDVEVNLQNEQDLKDTVSTHSYDMLLSTISIGADPDVFAFWHSTQADVRSKSRLNFSEYKSREADASLEAGRSRSDPRIRAAKYQAFLKSWSQDNPALALYQPNYTFIVHPPFSGFDNETLSNPIDRYSDVDKWMIRQQRR